MNEGNWFAFLDASLDYDRETNKWYAFGRAFKRKGQAVNYVWKKYKKLKNIPDRYL